MPVTDHDTEKNSDTDGSSPTNGKSETRSHEERLELLESEHRWPVHETYRTLLWMERPATPSEVTAEATERLSEQQIRTAIENLENEDFIQSSASTGQEPKQVWFAEDDCSTT